MINKRVRQLLAEDRPAWGLFINLAEPAVVEIAGHAGYDFAIFDMEHTSLTFQSVENLLRASGNVGMTGIVRVPDKNPKTILRAVDIGADGVMVPHVLDASEARQVVEAARYRPEGDRGISGVCRAANYGATPFLKHAEQSNRDLLVSVMIEDQSAAEDIEAIAAVEGLDVCF